MAEPKTEIDRRINRIELAISHLVELLDEEGFLEAHSAEEIKKTLYGKRSYGSP